MLDEGNTADSSLSVHGRILQSTLDATNQDASANPCVICLENVSEKAIARPCNHDNFDFICLASWIQEKSTCPLCKAVITAIHYGITGGKPKVYQVDSGSTARNNNVCFGSNATANPTWVHQFRDRQRYPPRQLTSRGRKRPRLPSPSNEAVLSRRRRIYELNLYSLHVGTNRLSGYSDLIPSRFATDPHLMSRARKWIRRELSLFDSFHGSQSSTSGRSSVQRSISHAERASSNAEFLLEYIIAILKTVDIRGSRGQAQEMLAGFLGENSALFLHELNSWLRSPFEELAVWDRNVRYNWPEDEGRMLDRSNREEHITRHEEERMPNKRRMYERWVPD